MFHPLRARLLSVLALAALAAAVPFAPLLWPEQAKLLAPDAAAQDEFGLAVAIDGNTALIGCHRDDALGAESGSVYVYVRNGASWVFQQRLEAGDGAPSNLFGSAVAIDGDTALVGSIGDGHAGYGSGSAHVFVRSAGVWTEQQKLTAVDADQYDAFGCCASISGDTAVIGADRENNSGAAYVFTRSGSTWTQQQKLKAGDIASGDQFGVSAAVWGDTTVVGALGDDDLGNWSGSAYVYVRAAGVWTPQQKLNASDGAVGDWFGFSAAIDGDTVAIGAYGEDGAGTNRGAAYLFHRTAGVWTEQDKLISDNPDDSDSFGYSVGLSGDRAAVGAYYDTKPLGSTTGAAYVFERSGSSWALEHSLWASDGSSGDYLGYSVGISEDTVLAGAPFDQQSTPGSTTGSAYLFVACPAVAAAELVRLGTPPNPGALLPGQTSGPVVGETWDPLVDHGSFFPSATLDLLILTALPLEVDLGPPLGTLLCDIITPTPILLGSPAGVPFAAPIPVNCNLVGKSLCAQGLSTDGILASFTNALDVTVGSF